MNNPLKLSITIQTFGKSWSETKKTFFHFDNWADAVIFAYRLAILHNREIRIGEGGQGHYFRAANAKQYLESVNRKKSA